MTTGMNTEDVMLREVSQRQIPYNPTCIWNLKTNKQTTNQTHRNREKNSETVVTGGRRMEENGVTGQRVKFQLYDD